MQPRRQSPVQRMEENEAAYRHARVLIRLAARGITEAIENNAVDADVLDLYRIPKDDESLKKIHAQMKRILEQL